jgi:membrane fusion protein, protease secretion system
MSKTELLQRVPSRHLTPVPAGEVEALPDELRPVDSSRATRIGLWALVIGFFGFLIWASFAPLDEGVPSSGLVSLDTKRKTIQHPTGGIIKEMAVHEGMHVKEGQLLFKLDDAATRANYETLRQDYLMLRASQGRLLAEQSGAAAISFHPDLLRAAQDPLVSKQMQTQEQLFRSRRASITASQQGLREGIDGQQALVAAYKSMLANARTKAASLNDELKQTRGLVAEGYAPRNRQLELERMVSDTEATMAQLLGSMSQSQANIAQLRQQMITQQQDYRKDVEAQLSDVSRQVEADQAKFKSISDDLARVEVRSPVEGQVVGLAVQTVGGVITSGQKVMDIVPENEPLLIETKVAPNLIDHVRAGLPVDIRFASFSNTPQLVVEGKVVSISGDLLADQNGATYFLSRVAVTDKGRKELGKRVLQPGMPVEVVFKTGERSLMTYLLHPLTKRIAAAMKEE